MTSPVETTELPAGPALDIDPADEASARAYIEAILRHGDVSAKFGPEFEAAERRRLWGVFATRYLEVSSPPLAKHGADALRVALLKV
jgi:hypothetical protein